MAQRTKLDKRSKHARLIEVVFAKKLKLTIGLTAIVGIFSYLITVCGEPTYPPNILSILIQDTNPDRPQKTQDRFLHQLTFSNQTFEPVSSAKIKVDLLGAIGGVQTLPTSFDGDCIYTSLGMTLSVTCTTLPVGGDETVFFASPTPLHGGIRLSADGASTSQLAFNCNSESFTGTFQGCDTSASCSIPSPCWIVSNIRSWFV